MRTVHLDPGVYESMFAHARSAYPEECCGLLIGPAPDGARDEDRRVVAAAPQRNRSAGDRRTSFAIAADDLRAADRDREGSGLAVTGFYHSHPDRSARPSIVDEDQAWPGYAYVVISLGATGPRDAGAFELDADSRRFRPVPLRRASAGRGTAESVSGLRAR